MKKQNTPSVEYIVGRFKAEDGPYVRIIRITKTRNRLGIPVRREEIYTRRYNRRDWFAVLEKFTRVSGPFKGRNAAREAQREWEGRK